MKLAMQRVQPDCVVVIDTLERLSPETWKDWGFAPTAKEAVRLELGASSLYTQSDLARAVAKIMEAFAGFEGCALHSLRYAGDESCTEENLKWMNELKPERNYTQVAEFLMDFHSPVEQVGAWEADAEYTDYQWWLARTADGAWDVLTWGFG